MSEETKIEWATHTFNPWEGCTKVSPGCANCYAEARNRRFSKGANWGKGKPRRRTSLGSWRKPAMWEDKATMDETELNAMGFRFTSPRVFPSLCDWLDDEVPIEWLADFLKLIHDTPNLDWLLLTKRPENYFRIGVVCGLHGLEPNFNRWLNQWGQGNPPENVWIGTSVEDQERADERIPYLINIPAKIRFLSCEPLLGPIDLNAVKFGDCGNKNALANRQPDSHLDWVIIGGESGPGARTCDLQWVRDIVRQCQAAKVSPFVKQVGSNPLLIDGHIDLGRLKPKHPKGGDMSEWPEDLRVREFPQ